MEMDKLGHNLSILNDAIVDELNNRRITPALILLHSALDTVGWLDSSERFATRRSFCDWADMYLLTSGEFDCTAIDLYAARCGLLHTLSPDSTLADDGRARQICWAWGDARLEDLRVGIKETEKEDVYVAVHVNDLSV